MESKEFIVLYTHQKMKKSKVWQDGILKLTHLGNKAILYDDKGDCLESIFLKHLEVKPGDELEGDRYLITVEEVKAAGSVTVKQDVKEAPELNPSRLISSGRHLGCQPAGLKRKFPGFQGPRQVSKKTVTTENYQHAVSLEVKKPDPALLSPFHNTSPLFSTAGKKDTNSSLADPENAFANKGRERCGTPSSLTPNPSLQINPEVLCGDNDFRTPRSSVDQLSDFSLPNKPMKRDNLVSNCFGISQNIRSKAQILALLKCKSTNTGKTPSSEIIEHFPQLYPQESLKSPVTPKCLTDQEKCAEVMSTETSHYQHQSENTIRKKSRWTVYLSSQSSPICSSDTNGSDIEKKLRTQRDDINTNMNNLLVQEKVPLFDTYAEMGGKYIEDKQAGNEQSFWNQEINFGVPSSCKNACVSVTYSNAENDSSLSSILDIQEKNEISLNHNDQICKKGPILKRENAPEVNTYGILEREYEQPVSPGSEEHLQTESSLGKDFSISDDSGDMIPESSANNEGISSINESMSNVTQPFLEINFNLSNFETSDTEEESQESSKISQDSECLVKEILVSNGNSCVQKRCEEIRCEDIGSEHLPLVTSVGDKHTEPLLIKKTLPSQLSARTCTYFDTGPSEAGKETEQEYSGTLSNFNSSSEWTDDTYVDTEYVNKATQKVKTDCDFASLPNKSKGTKPVLYGHQFLNSATNQTLGDRSLFSEDTEPQHFILGSDLEKNEQVLPSASDSDSSMQLLNISQDHSECIALDESNIHISNSSFYPLGEKQSFATAPESHNPEPEDLRIEDLPSEDIHVAYAGDCNILTPVDGKPTESLPIQNIQSSHPSSSLNTGNSSELSGLLNDISLLKSLSEHSTALESLEIMKKKNESSKQQETPELHAPESSPQAWKPLTTVVSEATRMLPELTKDSSEQMMKEDEVEEVETNEPFESLQPVEFQGHQVKGSAASAVMVRKHSSELSHSLFPDSTEYENFLRDSTCFPTSELPGTHMEIDFLQVSHQQNISTVNPVSTFPLTSRDGGFIPEFSEESMKARTLSGDLHILSMEHRIRKNTSLEKKNLQRLPLVSRTRVPLITLPPADGPPDLDSCSYVISGDTQESSDSSIFNLCEESTFLSCSFESEDQSEALFFEDSGEETQGSLSLLSNLSTQSKWLKYQSVSQDNLTTPDRADVIVRDGFFAEASSGIHFSDINERQCGVVNKSSLDSVHLQMIKGMLYQQQQDFGCQDFVSRKTALSLNLEQISKTEEIQTMLGEPSCYNCCVTGDVQEINNLELSFPSGQKIKYAYLPQRKIHIPAVFQSPAHYKQVFTSCLIEHLNILLFVLSQRLYKALSKVDISFYTSSKEEKLKNVENAVPFCHHHQPAKLVMVKKEGSNKGRLFYTCDGPKANRCKFFKWFEEVTQAGLTQAESGPSMVLSDIKSIGLYLRSQNIPIYEECQLLVRKAYDFQGKRFGKLKKFTTVSPEFLNEPKSKLYLKLSRKENSSTYSKDDLWVISKTLDFELDTFIAHSAFFGPSSMNEVELLPLKGYFPSNWPTNTVVHALLVCNASTELTTLKNIQNYFNPATLPLMQHLLAMSSSTAVSNKRVNKKKFIPPAFMNTKPTFELNPEMTLQLASEMIQVHRLNQDQAAALIQIAQMVTSHESAEVEHPQRCALPITIIHGVFGAGKSYLLAVVILFFVQLFEMSEAPTVGNARQWKLLISSSTNVAVDRVLLGLLSLGFEKFVRVGSVRKIAKPVLPYSLHASSENENEQLKELHALMKDNLTPVERVYVRKSIEQHKLGTNKTLLKQVRVVGVTCAACPFSCLNELKFPVVVLDECSQITEPASLLPIARFECEKLILVGDPKQLPPTIQGSDAAHESGLEQTLFDRLCLMGHKPILLRTQYRCHPAISAVANDLFYEGNLMNGISETERSPLLEWLPTLCFYNVKGLEQIERDNSFHNVAEAAFILKLIQSLIASGVAGSMIGVITLYKSQMYKLCHLLNAVDFDHSNIKAVQVSTVDAFQGAEKEIIILSCVRTRQLGFIDSEKRMNVALTRGRRHLLIVGHLTCLRKNHMWARVIQHCEGREDGLQQASQYEPQLNQILKDYLEKQAEEKEKKKNEKEK
ncbi:5'-3' DNA helicase ZGRF1 [Rhynchocyon petersi]